MKSSIKNDMTLLCLTVIIAIALPVHAKNINNNNNGQPLQTQPENGNNSRIQVLEAEDIRLQQLIDGLGHQMVRMMIPAPQNVIGAGYK